MAGLGLGGSSGSSSKGRTPDVTGVTVRDSQGNPAVPGLRGPGGVKYEPYGGTGRVPDTRGTTPGGTIWDQVGVPMGSSLVIGTTNGRTSVPYSPANTYTQLEQIMSGSQRADNKPMQGSRANLTSVQKFLIRTGAMKATDISRDSDWGNPAHDKTREALLSLMQQGNYSGYSWFEVAAGAGLSTGQRKMLEQSNGAGSGSGSGGGSGPFTQVSKSTAISNRQDARALLRATMQSMLGRSPEKSEVKAFLATLNREEEQNPVVTTSTTDNGETTGTSDSTTEGGINRDEFASSYVRGQFDDEASDFEGDNYEMMILNAIGSL